MLSALQKLGALSDEKKCVIKIIIPEILIQRESQKKSPGNTDDAEVSS